MVSSAQPVVTPQIFIAPQFFSSQLLIGFEPLSPIS